MKKKIKAILADIMYWVYQKRICRTDIEVMSIDETLNELLSTDKSLVRFGDGEIIMIRGKVCIFSMSRKRLHDGWQRFFSIKKKD